MRKSWGVGCARWKGSGNFGRTKMKRPTTRHKRVPPWGAAGLSVRFTSMNPKEDMVCTAHVRREVGKKRLSKFRRKKLVQQQKTEKRKEPKPKHMGHGALSSKK